MYTNNRRYISEIDTRDAYINLDLRLGSSSDIWSSAVSMFRNRIEGRYLGPAGLLIQLDVNKNGFAAMALNCLLIETFMQFRNGFPQTPEGANKRWYVDFLVNQFGCVFDETLAKRFYGNIRCGILHSAQSKGESCLTFGTEYVARIQGNGTMMVDVQGVYNLLDDYFEKYCNELMNIGNAELRRNFISKMNDITKKSEGSEALDNLWFAICAHQGEEFEVSNGKKFIMTYVRNQSIRINNSISITKEDIEDAMYYWPNESAMRMQNKSNYIIPLLHACRNIVDNIVQKEIA